MFKFKTTDIELPCGDWINKRRQKEQSENVHNLLMLVSDTITNE